jgi:allophanate hydrolase subunit 1
MSGGYNTLQAAWESCAATLPAELSPKSRDIMRLAFYLGGMATLKIVKDAARLDKAAFSGILNGLWEEAALLREQQAMATFRIPLIGDGPEVAGRIEFAIPLATAAAEKEGCPALCAYLLEAIQHALVFGVSREEIADDVKDHADWWQERMHAGVSPEAAAREARGELKEGA